MLSIAFVGEKTIAELNKRYLRRRGATDIITFAFRTAGGDGGLIGDIYICPKVARENARQQRVRFKEEILRLVVHGVLHAIGYDHPEGADRMSSPMWKQQERIVARVA